MKRSSRFIALGALSVLAIASACWHDGPTSPDSERSGFLLSDPVETFAGAPDVAGLTTDAPTTVYVAAEPGAFPEAIRMTVRNRRTLHSVSGMPIEGGLDPVAISAAIGDVLEIAAIDAAGMVTTTATAVVPASRPPVVVRTIPPRGKKDVPLNARIVVVFSEPLDPSTVTAQSIRLLRNGTPVAGEVTLSADGLKAEHQPSELLAGQSTYVLQIGTTVADLGGDHLEVEVQVGFTTGSSTNEAFIHVEPTVTLAPGETAQPLVIIDDGNGPLNAAVSWSSADTSVARVDAANVITAVAPGSTTLTVSAPDATPVTVSVHVVRLSFVAVVAGGWHNCALTSEGIAYCWGDNWFGAVGHGLGSTGVSTPAAVAGGLVFSQLSAGENHSCGITTSGDAFCWGLNKSGQLGAPSTERCGVADHEFDCSTRPVRVSGGLQVTSISAGETHTCAVATSGAAYCWGDNPFGELGTGSTTASPTPVAVAGGIRFASISAGGNFTCGISTLEGLDDEAAASAAFCWGLAHGYGQSRTAPVRVSGEYTFSRLSTGAAQTCGVTVGGEALCWGYDHLGIADSIPALANGTSPHIDISAATAGGQTCAVTADGQAFCWGYFHLGPTSGTYTNTPQALPGEIRFKTVTTGYLHSCGLGADDVAYCWGHHFTYGTLGNGVVWGSATPTRVSGQR